jgi:crossover junction endodeoxyribonuclease RuvC
VRLDVRVDTSPIRRVASIAEGIRADPQNPAPVNVLGIDPGLANTGYGLVTRRGARFVALDGGVVTTRAGLPLEQRLTTIFAEIDELLERHRPDAVALEDLFFGQNARSAFAVGQARGVVMLAAGRRGVPCSSYTPQQVKQAVCGTGRAAKDQVARMVCAVLGLPDQPLPDHATDALAVGVCHANHAPLAQALAAAR